MNVYSSEKIRNVVVLGHGGCGKTTLVEALAHTAGVTKRLGRVEEGNTISDYDKEEAKRLFSRLFIRHRNDHGSLGQLFYRPWPVEP